LFSSVAGRGAVRVLVGTGYTAPVAPCILYTKNHGGGKRRLRPAGSDGVQSSLASLRSCESY